MARERRNRILGVSSDMAAPFAGLVALSHLQFSQIRRPPALLNCAKDSVQAQQGQMRQYAPKTVGKWVGRFCAQGVDTSQPEIGISKASVSRILKRRGLSRLSSLELPYPRYEREKPGEIILLDRLLQQSRCWLGIRPGRYRRPFSVSAC
jgi:hypothetical protein